MKARDSADGAGRPRGSPPARSVRRSRPRPQPGGRDRVEVGRARAQRAHVASPSKCSPTSPTRRLVGSATTYVREDDAGTSVGSAWSRGRTREGRASRVRLAAEHVDATSWLGGTGPVFTRHRRRLIGGGVDLDRGYGELLLRLAGFTGRCSMSSRRDDVTTASPRCSVRRYLAPVQDNALPRRPNEIRRAARARRVASAMPTRLRSSSWRRLGAAGTESRVRYRTPAQVLALGSATTGLAEASGSPKIAAARASRCRPPDIVDGRDSCAKSWPECSSHATMPCCGCLP